MALLGLYIVSDSFTSQWQSRLYQNHKQIDQFQMMFGVNSWAIIMTSIALVAKNELFTTLVFLRENPMALVDNVTFTASVSDDRGRIGLVKMSDLNCVRESWPLEQQPRIYRGGAAGRSRELGRGGHRGSLLRTLHHRGPLIEET